VAVDTEFHQTMFDLHQTVNPREEIVGWYATGTSLNVMSVLVHDFYGRSCEQPVHLTLDNVAVGGSMSLKTFVSSAVSLAKRSFGSQFREVAMTVMPFAPEAVNDLVATERRVDALTAPNRLGSELDGLKRSLKKLGQMLTDACTYVDDVNSGKIKGDKRIGRMLGDAIARIPHHSGADFEKVFTDNIQDMLMVAYLANLTKAQIALSEKLQVMGLAQKQNRRRGGGGYGKDGGGGGGGKEGGGGGGGGDRQGGGDRGPRGGGGGGGGGGEERGPPPTPLRDRIV